MTHTLTRGGITLNCEVIRMGYDMLIALSGGDSPHIGSVSMAVSRPSLAAAESNSATVSTYVYTGHMDNRLSDAMAGRLAGRLNCHVAVACGVHIENITREQIEIIIQMCDELTELVLRQFMKRDADNIKTKTMQEG